MKTTTEVEIKVGERILGGTEIGEGTYRCVIETEVPDREQEVVPDMQDDVFVLIEASKLSLDDKFMKHRPKNKREKKFKELLTNVIRRGIKDFYRPKYDPSFNGDGTGVSFKAGKNPAGFITFKIWKELAKEFMPKRCSRLGTKSEYVAFLGVLIKQLVADGWSVAEAWNAVCNDSKKLGHYRNSDDANKDGEYTGMREICGFFDLGNTCKLLDIDYDDCPYGFWEASGCYSSYSDDYPLADIERCTLINNVHCHSVGWIVLS